MRRWERTPVKRQTFAADPTFFFDKVICLLESWRLAKGLRAARPDPGGRLNNHEVRE